MKETGEFVEFYGNVVAGDAENRRKPLFSSFGETPSLTIPQFQRGLSYLRSLYPANKPAFLDCGSGDGMMVALAAIAGFRSDGIELDQQMVSLSRQYLKTLSKLGIIPQDSDTKIIHGSYYFPDALPNLKNDLDQELSRRYHSDGILDTDNFEEYVGILFSQFRIGRTYTDISDAILGRRTNVYHQLGIPLPYDVVYHYSSDFLSPSNFLPQMAKLLRSGSRVVLFQTGNSENPNQDGFTQEQTIPIVNSENNQASLNILIKYS